MAPLRRLFSRSAVPFGMRFGTRMNAGDSLKRPLLSRWPAAFIAAVLIGTTALVLYVEASVSKLKQRSEEHTSELQSLMRISYAVFCLKKKKSQETTRLESKN